jgi:hypothetical protein
VKFVAFQFELRQFDIANFAFGVVVVRIQRSLDDPARARRRVGDQVDAGLVAYQRLAAPVLCNEAEQSVFDLVPLAGARWKVAHEQLQAQVIRQLLQRYLPQPRPTAIAATAVGRDQQFVRTWEPSLSPRLPPVPNAVDRELRRVMVAPHVDPALVVQHVIHAVGNRLPQVRVEEVMHADFFRFAAGGHSRPPFLTSPIHSFFFVSTDIAG